MMGAIVLPNLLLHKEFRDRATHESRGAFRVGMSARLDRQGTSLGVTLTFIRGSQSQGFSTGLSLLPERPSARLCGTSLRSKGASAGSDSQGQLFAGGY